MHLVAAAANSPETTKYLVIGVSALLTVILERSRLFPAGLTPVVLLYGNWVRRRIRRVATERFELHR
jgi:hypothetical protein